MVSTIEIASATLENIDSLLLLAQQQYSRSKSYREAYGNKRTLRDLNNAIIELELVQQKKQELLKKKLVM